MMSSLLSGCGDWLEDDLELHVTCHMHVHAHVTRTWSDGVQGREGVFWWWTHYETCW